MLNWLYTLADWLTPGRDRADWRPARLELSASGFTIERPKAAPIAIAWADVTALMLTAVKRHGEWVACLTVTHRPARREQPVLSSWGNFPAFAAELGTRLGRRDGAAWGEALFREASPDIMLEIPLPKGGLLAAGRVTRDARRDA